MAHRDLIVGLRRSGLCKEDHRQDISIKDVPPDQFHVHDFRNRPTPTRSKECPQIGGVVRHAEAQRDYKGQLAGWLVFLTFWNRTPIVERPINEEVVEVAFRTDARVGDAVFRDGLRVISVRRSFERLTAFGPHVGRIAYHGGIARNVDIAETGCGLIAEIRWNKAVGAFGNVDRWNAFCPHSLAERQEVPEQLDLSQNGGEGVEIVPRSILNDGAG